MFESRLVTDITSTVHESGGIQHLHRHDDLEVNEATGHASRIPTGLLHNRESLLFLYRLTQKYLSRSVLTFDIFVTLSHGRESYRFDPTRHTICNIVLWSIKD